MLTAAFGMSDAMVEYMDLTGDKQFVETLSRFAANCTEPSVVSSWTWPGGYFRIYGEALRITGDQRWAEALNKALGVWLDRMKRCGSALPQEEWPGRFESAAGGGYPGAVAGVGTDANTFRDLPFAMEAVISAKGANR